MEDFYTTMGNKLAPEEIIREIHLPLSGPGTKQRFFKVRERNTIDFAISSIASAINVDSDIIKDARIVLGAVAPFPFRAVRAEAILKGQPLNQATADSAAEEAVSGAKPLSMNAHKLSMIKALVKRAILE
jgi:xanthine dehydrogenase YagS FAD-binding subunit